MSSYIEKMSDRGEVQALLNQFHLDLEDHVETYVIRNENGLVGTCSFKDDTIRSFAIKPCYQNSSVTAELLTYVINRMFDNGITSIKAVTKLSNMIHFSRLGFKCLYKNEDLALMNMGENNLNKYLKSIEAQLPSEGQRSAIIMNGNPFTKGHYYLIKQAAHESDFLIVFVVDTDASVFPFEMRLEMIKEGVKELGNVLVVPSGQFMVSQSTFPEYFERKMSVRTKLSASLDAGIFSDLIAKTLRITRRYVGTEPYCELTRLYNKTLKETFKDLNLRIIKRLGDKPISASHVRQLIKEVDMERVKSLVPDTTWSILLTNRGQKVIETLRNHEGVH